MRSNPRWNLYANQTSWDIAWIFHRHSFLLLYNICYSLPLLSLWHTQVISYTHGLQLKSNNGCLCFYNMAGWHYFFIAKLHKSQITGPCIMFCNVSTSSYTSMRTAWPSKIWKAPLRSIGIPSHINFVMVDGWYLIHIHKGQYIQIFTIQHQENSRYCRKVLV